MPPMMVDEADSGSESSTGTLFVVATPIGNLSDLSPRARELLGRVGLVAAEDTRVSRRLLSERVEPVRMVSVNEHSERGVVDGLISQLQSGRDIALVSDAGTPLISDPGYRLVDAAHQAGIAVCPLPGPCAAIAALSVAGLASDRFLFEGFLPARRGPRRTRLSALADQPATLIFYAPARDLEPVLADMVDTFGAERLACLARELTKLHETVRRDSLSALREWVAHDSDQKRGEAVLVVAGNSAAPAAISPRALASELARELPPARAAKVLARLSDLTRQQAWDLIQSLTTDA
jgi:16S rRNA (cytidine1402-2'-O)-methyltransferase